MGWMFENTFFCDTLHKQLIPFYFPKIWPIFIMTKKFGPKWNNGKLSNPPIWTIEFYFSYVLFRRFLIPQSHITSHSPYTLYYINWSSSSSSKQPVMCHLSPVTCHLSHVAWLSLYAASAGAKLPEGWVMRLWEVSWYEDKFIFSHLNVNSCF